MEERILGAIRNGGLIPHDNDADFDILETDVAKILKLKKEFAKYNLVIIEAVGWGLQISFKDSPDLPNPNLWTKDNKTFWTSKFPFLDLITIKYDDITNKYICAGEVAYHDYPNYYLTKDEWEGARFGEVKFGDLSLKCFNFNNSNYLNKNYSNWNRVIEMNMNHRANEYFEKPIVVQMKESDRIFRARSDKKSLLIL